jgi:hypothetical protein
VAPYEVGADPDIIKEVDNGGRDAWNKLGRCIAMAGSGLLQPANDDDMSSLLRVMSLLGNAP